MFDVGDQPRLAGHHPDLDALGGRQPVQQRLAQRPGPRRHDADPRLTAAAESQPEDEDQQHREHEHEEDIGAYPQSAAQVRGGHGERLHDRTVALSRSVATPPATVANTSMAGTEGNTARTPPPPAGSARRAAG